MYKKIRYSEQEFFDIPALFVLKTRKSRTGKFKITLHTYLNSILNLLVIFLATQIKEIERNFQLFLSSSTLFFFYTNHEILFKKSYQMRSPDDDDEVHNSISKLLWLRQPLSAHLSSLSLCDLLFGGSSYGIVMLQVLQRSFSMLCPSLEFHLITTKLRTVLQKSRRREILKMPLFLYYYRKKLSGK